jgi:transposase
MTSEVINNQLFDATDNNLEKPPVKSKVPAGVSKTFRSYDTSQMFLLPPSLDEWLPDDHSARFISEVVEELLDLDGIYSSYIEASGAPPYDPKMMLKLVLYSYSIGVTSAREMERRCYVDVAFRWICANIAPDHRSISRFRRRHLDSLKDLFLQVLRLCGQAGLVKLGRIALDGTKLRANASRRKAMSYDHITPRMEQLEKEVAEILAEAEAIDEAEDKAFGVDNRGDEVPAELARRETRLSKLRAAKEAIETDAKQKAREQAIKNATKKGKSTPEIAEAAAQAEETAVADPKAQRSFTDPESRMMKTNDGYHYAYNGQAVVDEKSQVIISAEITQAAADVNQLMPMIKVTRENLESIGINTTARVVLLDAGYCSKENLEQIANEGINALIATGRLKHNERVPNAPRGRIPSNATDKERMARRLRTKQGRKDYARRKAIVEPAFGQMKVKQHTGQLRLRGLAGASGEWTLHVICHNLRKLANSRQNAVIALA